MYDGHGNPIDDSESGAMRKAIDKRLMYPGLSCIVCVFPQGQNRTDFFDITCQMLFYIKGASKQDKCDLFSG